MKCNYEYQIVNSWEDNDDFYIDYIVRNLNTNKTAYACCLLDVNEIDNYNNQQLISLLEKNNGSEFDLPKTSELSKITYDIYKELCASENNMLYIEDEDDIERFNINPQTYKLLLDDINKYNLKDYFERRNEELIVYGGLQCCFNDDVIERTDAENER